VNAEDDVAGFRLFPLGKDYKLVKPQQQVIKSLSSEVEIRYSAIHTTSWAIAVGLLLLSGCGGVQSALDPAGREAEQIAELFWWLVAGAGIVWLAVIALAVYAIYARPEAHKPRTGRILIVGGGAVFPTVVLAGYLVYGLALMPDMLTPAPEGSLNISVSGEQWWWRVRYPLPDGGAVELANEIHLPVGERVNFILDSPDVIHSFWIPSLGGKIDMIPGRTNLLALEPTQTGVFKGACAEYCGTSHALMTFYVVVHEREAFDRWLEQQAEPAEPPTDPLAVRGRELFLANGCGACHTVRGTPADGTIGPDLTHVGSRLSIGAGTLPGEPDAFLQWIAHTSNIKPEVLMPEFPMLRDEELRAMAAYLDGLE
jgi:cytochrome c oxidase subunit II